MGNVLGHVRQPDWVPNILPDGRGDRGGNDVNNPCSAQTRDAFVSYTVPTVAVVLFAKTVYSFHQERKRLELEYESKLKAIEAELDDIRAQTDVRRAQQTANHRISEKIQQIERQEICTYVQQLHMLDAFDEGLKRILEIRCSRFKSHKLREPLESELLAKTATDHSLRDISVYHGVKDSIDYDHRYCGTNRDNNGKFRQLYMQMYREKLKVAKERRVLTRIEEELESVD